jgi:hypothetical protein
MLFYLRFVKYMSNESRLKELTLRFFPVMSTFYFVCQFFYKYSFMKLDLRYDIVTITTKICPTTLAVGLRYNIPTAEL